jgi:solute:Na+ symporter, SSS family
VAAETSTLTIISIPGLAYDSNLTFLQVVMGYVIGRVIISFVLLPQYFRGELYTAYQLIERRFGPELRTVTAGLFLLTRAAAEGVRVYAVSIVVSIALGTGEVASIAIITLLTLIYTFEGGLAAVIWTDVVQTFIYVGGTLVGLVTILHLVPGGWGSVEAIAGGTAQVPGVRSRALPLLAHWPYLNFAKPYTLWAGIHRRRLLDHGQPWHRPTHRAAIAGGAQSAAIGAGIAVERSRGLFSVCIISFCGRDAVCLLPGSVGCVLARRPNLSDVHREPDAAWHCGAVDRRDSGGGDVELSAALNSLSSSSMMDFYLRFRPSSPEATRGCDWRDWRPSRGPWCCSAGGAGAASRGARGGSRVANRVGRLWSVARSISAGRADRRANQRRNRRHDLRIRDGTVFVGMVARGFYLVGRDRNLCDVCGGIRGERVCGGMNSNEPLKRRDREAISRRRAEGT